MNNKGKKTELPIQVIIGDSTCAQVRAEWNNNFGWKNISGGRERTLINMSLARSKEADYAEILQLDGLGLEEQKKRNKGKIYQELIEKLEKSK